MKEIDYEGTLTDDITLVKEYKTLLNKLKKKRKIFTIAYLLICLVVGILCGVNNLFFLFPSLIILGNSIYGRFSDKIIDKKSSLKNKKKLAKRRIEDLVEVLRENNKDSKDLISDVKYDNIKDALIVSEPTTLEKVVYDDEIDEEMLETNNLREPDYEIEGSFDEYLDVIVSYIYYLDSNNKINAFKETKKTKHFDEKPNIFNQKVIAARKAAFIREIKLETVDDIELSGDIPVKTALKLKQD